MRRPNRMRVIRQDGKPDVIIPLEHVEQARVVSWARMQARRHPALDSLFAIPNGSYKTGRSAALFKAEGLRSGVPDLMLPWPAGGHHGLFLEMKRVRGGTVSKAQREWLQRLSASGYRAEVCRGADQAIALLREYIGID